MNGAAVAGGAGLVSVCDLAVAVPEARFGYPEVRRGLVAAMVMPHLLRHVGERMARYLLLSGELIEAEEAYRAGLVNAVATAEQLLPRARLGACAGRRRTERAGAHQGTVATVLTSGRGVGRSGQGQCRAAFDGRVQARIGGVFPQAAGAVDAGLLIAAPPLWFLDPCEQLVERQAEMRQDIAAVESITFLQAAEPIRRRVNVHRARIRIH